MTEKSGRTHLTWAVRLPTPNESGVRDFLVMLYSLAPGDDDKRPMIVMPGMTHEVTVYEVDPATPVDFDKSLFEQKEVSPLTPAMVGYQFRAACHFDAVGRISDLVKLIADLVLPPDAPGEWVRYFRDGVDIATRQLDMYELRERMAVETPEAESRSLTDVSTTFKKHYRFEKAPSALVKTGRIAGFVLLGAALSAAMIGTGLSVEPDWAIARLGAAVKTDEFHRELVMPDGSEIEVGVRHIKGDDPRKLRLTEIRLKGAYDELSSLDLLAKTMTGPEADRLADEVHDRLGDTRYSEAQMPNGDVFITGLKKVPGVPHRYAIVSRAKVEPVGTYGVDRQTISNKRDE